MKKRVLIIGSSGMLGVDLSKELRKSFEVYSADIKGSEKGVKRFYPCDITKKHVVAGIVSKCRPDVVVLTAAWTDVDGCERDPKKAYRVNTQGVENAAVVCKAAGVPLVYISTDFIFNGKKRSPYKESDRPAPLSVYGDSKLQGELAIRKVLKEHIIVRTSWLYGKHGKNFVDTIIAKARTEPLLKVVDDQVGSPTFTKDLARALRALLGKIFTDDEYGTYHVSNAGKVSWCDYAKAIVRLAGLKAKVVPISSKDLDRPAKRPAMSVLDCGAFSRLTGFKMPHWKRSLKEYMK